MSPDLWLDTAKAEFGQIKLIDKHIDRPDRIVLAQIVIQPLRKQSALTAVIANDKARHRILRPNRRRIISLMVFSHSLDPKRTSIQANIYSLGCGHYAGVMAPPCAVLLDLDGTLIDSQPGILASCLAALRTLGHEPNEILDIKRVIGPPLEDAMQFLLQPYRDDRIAEAVLAFRQHYGESGLLGSEPYPGIGNSLREMQQRGLRIYLATSKRAAFARRILEHLELAAYFDGVQ